MSGNQQKTPLGQSLQKFGRRVADDAAQIAGKILPASVVKIMGAIVTAKFEVNGNGQTLPSVDMPTLGSRYIRLPIQQGEKGMMISAETYMGGMSGQGGGTADLSTRGNLSRGVWVPVGSVDWPAVDPNTLVLVGGPNGVSVANAEGGSSTFSITSSAITMTCGGHNITIDSAGVHIDGKIFLLHTHTGVTTGASNSGAVT